MSDYHFLSQEKPLPHGHESKVVQWHVYRQEKQAVEHIKHIVLGSEQKLVGGYCRDSIGPLWWVGVEVESVERWGNKQAINKPHAQ